MDIHLINRVMPAEKFHNDWCIPAAEYFLQLGDCITIYAIMQASQYCL